MAQFLIRKREHFAEAVKPAAWSDLKWSGRPLRGDIVEVRPNGYWRIEALGTGDKGWDRAAFALIQVTGMSVAAASQYQGSYTNATDTTAATVQFKNRYGFPSWTLIPWVKTMVTVGGVTVEEWYYIRANFAGAVQPIDKVT